jgi:sugar-specific transcriptional regulator TrmB
MPTDFFKIFTALGLSKIETRVYMAAFELGPTSIQDIAKKAKLSRTATYETVKLLQDRGLMSTYTSGKKRFFASEDPERALAHFKQTITTMQSQLDVLSRSLGEMKLLAGGERPTVRFYEGKEAIYALYADVAKTNPTFIQEITNIEEVYAHMDRDALMDARKLLGDKPVKILACTKAKNPVKTAEIRYLDQQLGSFQGDVWIYADRIALVTYIGRMVTIIIENAMLADTMRIVFNAAWGCSTPAQVSEEKK